MTEHTIESALYRLLCQQVSHLTESIAHVVVGELFTAEQPQAIVIGVDTLEAHTWGTERSFATVGTVEIYR
jgi:hypothetical protein